MIGLLEDQWRDKARINLMDFTRYTWSGYRANWHHKKLCEFLDKLVKGEIKRLLVFMPPRHGKSELVSRRLPAYALGRNPNEQIMAASYSSDLAGMMNADVQRIMDSPEYKDLYPDSLLFSKDTRLLADGKYKRTGDFFQVVNHRGQYRSAGVGGGITGMGFTLGIIDDPIKNPAEAESPTVRQRHWQWFVTTFMTRMQKDARVLVTLTRWHEDDLAGRILELQKSGLMKDGEAWTVLNLPAINEDGPSEHDPRQVGEPLWADDFDTVFLQGMKVLLGSRDFNSLYQQRPTGVEGGIIKRAWLRRYKLADLPPLDVKIMSWDCAFDETETSSFVVGQVWGRAGPNCYLIDQIRERMDFVKTIDAFNKMTEKHPDAIVKLIEKKANGSAMRSVLKTKVQGIVMYTPRGDKPERLKAVSPLWEAGNVLIPVVEDCPWVDDYIEEVVGFPNTKNDDQVDTTSQALNRLKDAVREVGPGSTTRPSPVPN